MDQTDLWQVAPRQLFSTCNCILISVGFVVLCCCVFHGSQGPSRAGVTLTGKGFLSSK